MKAARGDCIEGVKLEEMVLLLKERERMEVLEEEGGTMYPETETVMLGADGLKEMGWDLTMAIRLLPSLFLPLVPGSNPSSFSSSSSS